MCKRTFSLYLGYTTLTGVRENLGSGCNGSANVLASRRRRDECLEQEVFLCLQNEPTSWGAPFFDNNSRLLRVSYRSVTALVLDPEDRELDRLLSKYGGDSWRTSYFDEVAVE